MVFVSHANPEDNDFALWLTLQLGSAGYPVWCDLTKLLGGERFWSDIEVAVRERTARFVYVLSRSSNSKEGPLKELQLAQNVERQAHLSDFVIPVAVDDLPFLDFNVNLARLTAIPFRDGWAGGLHQLLAKLEKDGLPKDPRFTPDSVASWWRSAFSADEGLAPNPERVIVNVLPILDLPPLWVHSLEATGRGAPDFGAEPSFPIVRLGNDLVSFAPAEDVVPFLSDGLRIGRTEKLPLSMQHMAGDGPLSAQIRSCLVQLLKAAWAQMLRGRGLPLHNFSSKAEAFYFRLGDLAHDRLPKKGQSRLGERQVVGFKTVLRSGTRERVRRFWHFAMHARFVTTPVLGFCVKPHVLFSDDGKTIWTSPARLASARRSQCRLWWNDHWRDRLLGSVRWLANQQDRLVLRVGKTATLPVRASPLTLRSPVAYHSAGVEMEPDYDLDDEASGTSWGDGPAVDESLPPERM